MNIEHSVMMSVARVCQGKIRTKCIKVLADIEKTKPRIDKYYLN